MHEANETAVVKTPDISFRTGGKVQSVHDAPDVVIVGGGPTGLFLGCLLAQAGVSFLVLERRLSRPTHSRSIGVHPAALDLLAEVDVAHRLVERGVCIREGVVFVGRRATGSMSFERCPPPHPFILSIPQSETEAILEARLEELAPGSLRKGVEMEGQVVQGRGRKRRLDAMSVEPDRKRGLMGEAGLESDGDWNRIGAEARWIVGCDGMNSMVRRACGIEFPGGPYPDTYVMGDFADDTAFGTRACIWLGDDGLVESFPLPDNKRRWVVRTTGAAPPAKQNPVSGTSTEVDPTPSANTDPDPLWLCSQVERRTGHAPDAATNTMTSAFGIQNYLARSMAQGKVLLAGDAAHVVSPIGGQGMNLGWLDAHGAARVIRGSSSAAKYNRLRRTSAIKAARRAGFNTWMGRPGGNHIKSIGIRAVLATPLEDVLARIFSMRGL